MPSSPSLSKKQALPLHTKGLHDRSQTSQRKGSLRLLLASLVLGSVVLGLLFFKVDIFSLSQKSPHGECRCVHAHGENISVSKQPGKEYPHLDGGEVALGFPKFLGNITLQRPKLLGFVGLRTGFNSVERRKALRETWLPSDPEGMSRLEQATGLAFRFFIGKTLDPKKMSELGKEIERYKDFLSIDLEEENLNQARKTLAFFKAAHLLFDADFYVKADDNIYLRPDRLATLLAKDRPSSRTYLGCMKKGPVVKNPKMKWYEPLGYMLGNEYFYHACGPIYALSSEVVASLASSRKESVRFFSNEDITVGAWMLAMNVDHEDNQHLCDFKCTDRSIAVWDVPKCSGLCKATKQLRELHNMDKCSKTPTLPAEAE